jgi:hydroxymethylpyrimidine/phosphomethylpyrimidine kinase
VLLAVAGHDPSYVFADGRGQGAGVDADREAAGEFGVACLSVVTAWTEQEGGRVLELGPVEPVIWLREALGLVAELRGSLGAIKFGLLPSEAAVRAAAQLVRKARQILPGLSVVVDPVLGASGGEPFLDAAGRAALIEDLMGQGVVLTPNRPEACDLAGMELGSEPGELARRLFGMLEGRDERRRGLVLTGGHGGEDPVRDVVVDSGGSVSVHEHPRVVGAALHGSGCRHASAVAANLALGRSLAEAAASAGSWVGGLVR